MILKSTELLAAHAHDETMKDCKEDLIKKTTQHKLHKLSESDIFVSKIFRAATHTVVDSMVK